MVFTRRSVLGGIGVALAGSTAFGSEIGAALDGITRAAVTGDGIGLAFAFDDDASFKGLSDSVRLQHVSSVESRGQADDGDVLHISSLPPGNPDPEGSPSPFVTSDYGLSLVNVASRGLTMADLAATDGGEGAAASGGISYDWYVTEQDVVGVDTDHEQVGVGPDEVWFVLQNGDGATPEMSGNDALSAVVEGKATAVFGTKYADAGAGEWHTRAVHEELRGDDAVTWRKLSVSDRSFTDVEGPLLESVGDATILAVGVGRGDPYWGPSVLDTFYRNLQVEDESYTLPATNLAGRGNSIGGGGSGQGQNDDT